MLLNKHFLFLIAAIMGIMIGIYIARARNLDSMRETLRKANRTVETKYKI